MTQKDEQSTTQPEQTRSSYYSPEDEISFTHVLWVLFRKKVLILVITSIFALASTIYAKSLTPIYQASIAFLEPQETFFSVLPDDIKLLLRGEDRNNPTMFFQFLSRLMSFTAKEEVFKNGDFLKKFYGENSTVSLESAVLAVHDSISMTKEKSGWVDKKSPEYDSPIVLKMEGSKPKVMAEFLTALAASARQNVAKEIYNQTNELVDSKVHQITSEIKDLNLIADKKGSSSTAFFTEALQIARELGIKDNNFDKGYNRDLGVGIFSQSSISSFMEQNRKTHVKVEITDNSIPTWFLYGEKALLLEINKYKNRVKGAYVSGLLEKETLLEKYKSIDLSMVKPKVYLLSRPSIPPTEPIKPNKRAIVTLGAAMGLFIGIIMAFLRNSIDQMRKEHPFSVSTQEDH